MYLRPNDVEVLHMEWTSRCPLFCQQCARTDWEVGKAVMPTLPMGDMKPDFVDKILPQFPNVDVLHVCGNYGDIIAYPYLLETLDIVNKHENVIPCVILGLLLLLCTNSDPRNRSQDLNYKEFCVVTSRMR